MALITAENAPVLQGLFNEVGKARPNPGTLVRVMYGKHTGKVGVVRKHFQSRYSTAYRYASGMSAHMLDARGRSGWCISVDADGDRFHVDADKVMVCYEKEGDY